MVKISVTYTRPSVSVPWHYEVVDMTGTRSLSSNPEWVDKHQSPSIEEFAAMGAGSLTLNASVIWASKADFDEFMSLPLSQAYVAARDAYNASNGITASEVTYETV